MSQAGTENTRVSTSTNRHATSPIRVLMSQEPVGLEESKRGEFVLLHPRRALLLQNSSYQHARELASTAQGGSLRGGRCQES